MKAITGVFRLGADAERAVSQLQTIGLSDDRLTCLTPAAADHPSFPTESTEQPGMGTTIGALVGGAAGLSAGPLLMAALIPGVGPVSAMGLLGGAFIAAASATAGAAVGAKSENFMSHGLPEDEIFVYEDALRKGRTVVIVMARDEEEAERFRELLRTEGAESVDAAREEWWVGLRSAEHEHYLSDGRDFRADEKFYRKGFESALHARTRCKEYDQVMNEMTAQMEDVEQQNGAQAAEAFQRGYERGRDYYQALCNESKAA
jgi:uncharacterized protein with PIN domain